VTSRSNIATCDILIQVRTDAIVPRLKRHRRCRSVRSNNSVKSDANFCVTKWWTSSRQFSVFVSLSPSWFFRCRD